MPEKGIKGKKEFVVTDDCTARAMGSGSLEVYATPSMISHMENVAASSIEKYLEPGQASVGTFINVRHLAAVRPGSKVIVESRLTDIDRKKMSFEIKVYDETGIIGEGEHDRFIIEVDKFMKKVEER
ncbi:MAG: thioesterase family protein [Clostridiales bacterium]|nr:thioesterase family protein [Clostridiales bacterium]MBS5878092.1 thioesterase family protein [Clostridiales bacterium]MDU0939324.1 thioesterase family protein [Clostridiales bacterium]MDU1042244.1 thioesterase family protein [Clostridiales bacterium]MDU3489655.1 thioesterase family protein [Clostridiales bacterium]